MKSGLEISVTYSDHDLLELRVIASNGAFSGQAEMHVGANALERLAAQLRGFPESPSDSRQFELGTSLPEYRGGEARLRFSCIDAAGHAAVEVHLRSRTVDGATDASESVVLHIGLEAWAIDRFVDALTDLAGEAGGLARLEAAA